MRTPPTDEQLRAAAQSMNALGADLYARLKSAPGNLAFSPASIAVAFGMTAAGARGETAEEMRRVLHATLAPDAQSRALGGLSQRWNLPATEGLESHTANRLYGHRRFPFEASYLARTRDDFGAPLEAVDFGNPEPVRAQINGWAAQQTRDRIRDLIPARGITDQTRLVLVNAMYFKGAWEDQFTPGATRPETFHVAGGAPAMVPTMHRTGHYAMATRQGFRVLEIPFAEGSYALDVVLPDRVDGLAQVEARLDPAAMERWFDGLASQMVNLALPKFRVEPELLRLRAHLEALGMHLAFTDRADFTLIANPPNPADRLQISEGFHKAFVDVNERGAEAAAATAVVMMRAGAAPNPAPPVEFRVDRPFLFTLRDVRTGAVLFVGRVSDPRRGAG